MKHENLQGLLPSPSSTLSTTKTTFRRLYLPAPPIRFASLLDFFRSHSGYLQSLKKGCRYFSHKNGLFFLRCSVEKTPSHFLVGGFNPGQRGGYESNGIISRHRGKSKTYLKPPPKRKVRYSWSSLKTCWTKNGKALARCNSINVSKSKGYPALKLTDIAHENPPSKSWYNTIKMEDFSDSYVSLQESVLVLDVFWTWRFI